MTPADQIYKIPVELRAIIESDELVTIIDEICDGFDIPYGWRGNLVRSTVRVLCGLLPPKDFVPLIIDEYYLEQDEALAIASKINERIFSAVKPQLASLYNIEDKQIAKKLQVPKKPKPEEDIVEEEEVEVKSPYDFKYETPTSQDLMPNIVPQINIVHPSILKQAQVVSPIATNDDIVPPPPMHNQFANQSPSSFAVNTPQTPVYNQFAPQSPVTPPPPMRATSVQTEQPRPSESALSNKLGGLKVDSYREAI